MAFELSKCLDCGKLFALRSGKTRCVACATYRVQQELLVEKAASGDHKRPVEEIAEATGLSVEDVREIVRSSAGLGKLVDMGDICAKCGRQPAQQGSEFCLDCRLELNKSLGEIRDDLADRAKAERATQALRPERSGNVVSAINRKRQRAGHTRFDPTPKGRYT